MSFFTVRTWSSIGKKYPWAAISDAKCRASTEKHKNNHFRTVIWLNKGNNKITEHRAIFQFKPVWNTCFPNSIDIRSMRVRVWWNTYFPNSTDIRSMRVRVWCLMPQQYFSYIVVVSFIDRGNQSTWRKPSTCHKSLINFTT